MVRKIRYRQVLRNRHSQKGRYLKEVSQQKSFWKEDKAPTPTIDIVREIHKTLGTWDSKVIWDRVEFTEGTTINVLTIPDKCHIYPKANYKPIKKCREAMKTKRWKEQEKRTLEFFEREGC
ncbi:hypothetical protein OB988_18830 [Bacillus cereus]|nr:hypothetical protein [Bacillus cereus]